MERLSRRQKFQEYREEINHDNGSNNRSDALNNYQNKMDQLQSQFNNVQNDYTEQRVTPTYQEKAQTNPYSSFVQREEPKKYEDVTSQYKDLFDLLNDDPKPQPVQKPIYEEPVREEESYKTPIYEDPGVEALFNEKVFDEPAVVKAPIVDEEVKIPENNGPIVIDTTDEATELDSFVNSIKELNEEKPIETTQKFEPVNEPDGIEIKNIDELTKEEINATLTDTIPFVIDDEAVKDAVNEYEVEEDAIEDEEEVPNKVLNVILVILIIVLVLVLGLIVYYILAGQGIIG